LISQGIGDIVEQLWPLWQQSTVVLLASTKQVVDGLQQNPAGAPAHCVFVELAQVESRLKRSYVAVERAVMEVEKTTKARKLRIRNCPIVRLCTYSYVKSFGSLRWKSA
jgi:hypothetical protein